MIRKELDVFIWTRFAFHRTRSRTEPESEMKQTQYFGSGKGAKPKAVLTMVKVKYLGATPVNLAQIGWMQTGDVFETTVDMLEDLEANTEGEYVQAPADAKLTAPRNAAGKTQLPEKANSSAADERNPVIVPAPPEDAPPDAPSPEDDAPEPAAPPVPPVAQPQAIPTKPVLRPSPSKRAQ
jgi:hypothetical protein